MTTTKDEVATVILEKKSRVVDGLTLEEDDDSGTLILEEVVGSGISVLDDVATVILEKESRVVGVLTLVEGYCGILIL